VVAFMDPMVNVGNMQKKRTYLILQLLMRICCCCAPFDSRCDLSPTVPMPIMLKWLRKQVVHVFCEKPLDLSMQRVVEVLKVVKESQY